MNIDILLCLNESFIFGAGTIIASINKYNAKNNICYHIFVPENQHLKIKSELVKRISQPNVTLNFYNYTDIPSFNILKNNLNERMAVQCVRILAPRACKNVSQNLIYIDADIICLGDISPLASLNLGDKPLAAVPDDPSGSSSIHVHDKALKQYFCSGVLVFNLKKWLATSLEDECIKFVATYKPKFPDQDALNYVCDGICGILSSKYNCMWKLQDDAVFIHFINNKPWAPWHFNKDHTLINLFRQHAKLFEPDVTQWVSFKESRNVLINYAFHRKGTKWISRKLFSRKCFKAGIYYYLRHLTIKYKQKGLTGILLLKSSTRS